MPHLAQSDTVPASLAMTRATDLLENMAMDGATRVSPHIAEAADCVGVSLNWRKGDAVLRICVPEDWGEVCYAHYSDGTAPAVLMQPLESVLLREWLKTFAPPKTRREVVIDVSMTAEVASLVSEARRQERERVARMLEVHAAQLEESRRALASDLSSEAMMLQSAYAGQILGVNYSLGLVRAMGDDDA